MRKVRSDERKSPLIPVKNVYDHTPCEVMVGPMEGTIAPSTPNLLKRALKPSHPGKANHRLLQYQMKRRQQSELRRYEVLEYRKQGASYREIAAIMGITHVQVARDVDTALSEIRMASIESVENLRQLELERLDYMLMSIAPKVRKGDLGAIDRALKIGEQRQLLMGMVTLGKKMEPEQKPVIEVGEYIQQAEDTRKMVELVANLGYRAGRASALDGPGQDQQVYLTPADPAPEVLPE